MDDFSKGDLVATAAFCHLEITQANAADFHFHGLQATCRSVLSYLAFIRHGYSVAGGLPGCITALQVIRPTSRRFNDGLGIACGLSRLELFPGGLGRGFLLAAHRPAPCWGEECRIFEILEVPILDFRLMLLEWGALLWLLAGGLRHGQGAGFCQH